MKFLIIFFAISLSLVVTAQGDSELYLTSNFEQAQKGDYVIVSQGKNLTLFHILAKVQNKVTIEEITIPGTFASSIISWTDWLFQGAPRNTSWIHYQIDLNNGMLSPYFSFTKGGWFKHAEGESFLQTLLQLKFYPLPDTHRKKIGHHPRAAEDKRKIWQPPLTVNGVKMDAAFNAYYTYWPEDGTFLSGKEIEIYLPVDSAAYPSYFPYWLQIKGVVGPAKARIVDSGKNALSPVKSPFQI